MISEQVSYFRSVTLRAAEVHPLVMEDRYKSHRVGHCTKPLARQVSQDFAFYNDDFMKVFFIIRAAMSVMQYHQFNLAKTCKNTGKRYRKKYFSHSIIYFFI